MDNELFSVGAIHALNKRFPNVEKLSIFDTSDLASDAIMSSMSLRPDKEYQASRPGSKILSATISDKICLLRYIDVTPSVEAQADTLTYLTLLKSFRHSHLEEVSIIGLIDIGTGRNKESKVS